MELHMLCSPRLRKGGIVAENTWCNLDEAPSAFEKMRRTWLVYSSTAKAENIMIVFHKFMKQINSEKGKQPFKLKRIMVT